MGDGDALFDAVGVTDHERASPSPKMQQRYGRGRKLLQL